MQTLTLDNGIRVVVQPRPVPLVAMYLWIEAGSADERPGEQGAAHFLEHMLFKGTPTYGVGEVPAAIEALGGDLNAYTSLESTVLHATVQRDGWREALGVIADMSQRSLLDAGELEREREVILEEVRGYASDPEEKLYEAVQSAIFPGHAYALPILGTAEQVRGLPRSALVDFWRREWTGSRTLLSIAGDVDPSQVLELANQLFGAMPTGEARRAIPEPAPVQGPQTLEIAGKQRQTRQAQVVWRGPPRGHPDQPAVELLALALGDGPGGVLPERLAEHQINLADPQGTANPMRAGGSVTLSFVPGKDSVGAQIAGLLSTLRQVLAEGLDEALVGRVRAGLLADHVFEAETVDGIAWNNAHFWSEYGDPRAGEQALRTTASLTAPQVSEAARRWLVPDNLVVGLLEPKARSQTGPAVKMGLSQGIDNPFAPLDVQHAHGPRLLVRPDNSDVVGVSIQLKGGRLREPSRLMGLASAWGQMVTAGADGLSAGQLSAALDRTGGEVWGSAGRSTISMNARFPAATALEGLSLTLSALASPGHDEQAWSRVQEELLHDAESAEDYAGWVAEHALWAALWPKHPWSRRGVGTPASIARLTCSHLGKFHGQHLAADNVLIAIVGRIPSSRVRELTDEWLSSLPDHSPPLTVAPGPGPTRSRTIKRTAPADQAHLTIGVRGLGVRHPKTPVAQVLSALLGAQGGRLFLDLREERGLAYSVWADHMQSLGGGVFEMGLATDPARLAEAVDALHQAIDRIVAAPPTPDEVQRTIRMLAGGRAVSQQRATFRASRLAAAALFGLPLDPDVRLAQWSTVTATQVHELACELLAQPRIEVQVTPSEAQ